MKYSCYYKHYAAIHYFIYIIFSLRDERNIARAFLTKYYMHQVENVKQEQDLETIIFNPFITHFPIFTFKRFINLRYKFIYIIIIHD